MDINLMGSALLRLAIRQNLVTFPSQVPTLLCREGQDTPERVARLYFVCGWSVKAICDRYMLSEAVIRRLLTQWRTRAVAAGYIQDIHPESLEALTYTYREPADDRTPWPAELSAPAPMPPLAETANPLRPQAAHMSD